MILPIRRIAAAAFAAVVLLAGSAAAEPPSTPAPAPSPASDCGYIRCAAQIRLAPSSWMQINDGPGYNPGDQQQDFDLGGTTLGTIAPGTTADRELVVRCLNSVRTEIYVTTRRLNHGAVEATIKISLYEKAGTTCSRADLDDTKTYTVEIPAGQQKTEWFYVDSPDDLSFSQGKLVLVNQLVPYFG